MGVAESGADATGPGQELRYGTAAGWWVIVTMVLGSGIVFLDGTIVNVALPVISADLDVPLGGLQWTLSAYLVTLSSLLLLGGSLGDRLGRRRMFITGLFAFTAASIGCGLAPTIDWLIAGRALQGVGGALLIPGSLSIIASTFHPDDRARAIGAWSGMAGVTSSIGPFVGGWLIDAVSWRLAFFLNVPLAAIAVFAARRHVPETRAAHKVPLDLTGAALITAALASISFAAIEAGPMRVPAATVGIVALVAFLLVERSSSYPMLPLHIFRSRQFSAANVTTFSLYAALSASFFLVTLRLQISLGYSALEAGVSFIPFTMLMLVLSPKAGQLSGRIGPRLPMTVGPVLAGIGMVLFSRISPQSTYLADILPAMVVFGLGMALTVAPLTATVMSSVEGDLTGVASGVNNAVSRFAGLLAIAVLPVIAGITVGGSLEAGLDAGYSAAMLFCAMSCAAGAVVAAIFIRSARPIQPIRHPSPLVASGDPGVLQDTDDPAG